MRTSKAATKSTKAIQKSFKEKLNFNDTQSFEDARRGFIATLSPMSIEHDKDRRLVYDLEALSFLEGNAPDTVNPRFGECPN